MVMYSILKQACADDADAWVALQASCFQHQSIRLSFGDPGNKEHHARQGVDFRGREGRSCTVGIDAHHTTLLTVTSTRKTTERLAGESEVTFKSDELCDDWCAAGRRLLQCKLLCLRVGWLTRKFADGGRGLALCSCSAPDLSKRMNLFRPRAQLSSSHLIKDLALIAKHSMTWANASTT